ncbi:hypothetical protein SAMN05421858_4470 [Haladaptatus litoreus]|uniref:Uncharacterized protein n=2 Tax=Haladaptatus litoreus TaxID=553468 RepID=A0A1N7EPJ3_9EURY|nr:hypothetical protein SAMN05421858_4470 [Haladaptatus litoreus]
MTSMRASATANGTFEEITLFMINFGIDKTMFSRLVLYSSQHEVIS